MELHLFLFVFVFVERGTDESFGKKTSSRYFDPLGKLLRSLALSIKPNFQLPEVIERVNWAADGTEDTSIVSLLKQWRSRAKRQ